MAKTVDKLPEAKKDPPKPVPKPAAPAPAVAAPAKAPASNGVAATAPAPAKHEAPKPGALPGRGTVARPTDVLELQGMTPFNPGPWSDYIKSFHGAPVDVDVKWGTLAPRTTLPILFDKDIGFNTKDYGRSEHQPLAIVQPFFAGLPEKLAPALFVKIHKDQLTGFAAPHAMKYVSALPNLLADPKTTEALGLVGFKLPSPKIENEIKDGHFRFGAEAIIFNIRGWVTGSLALGLVDDTVAFTATAHVKARGIADGDLTISRDKDGHYTGSLHLAVTIGKASGDVLATYVNGDITITGTLKYASDKFSGSLTVMFGDVNEVQKAARGQLDPSKVMEDEKVPDDGGAEKTKKGEKGVAAWGEFNFAFTDWMTGTALGILDPFGHITIVGKIAPPKQIELMKEIGKNIAIPPFPLEITARYGLPYVADVHVGVGFELGAVARIGPAVLTDIVVQGTYSTDPKILQDFSISGAFRISAYAGLNLSIYGVAGLTILKHDIDFIAKITGSAGIKAYAEARPTIGYREKADPLAGKKGEAYLQGHLEAAAQPVLGLSGDLEVKLSSPWWSPAPNKTWTWPLFSLEWPIGSGIGIGADIDYVIGSDKLPDVTLGKVDFDASKFMDSALDNQLPQKSGSGDDKEKAGTWKGKDPPPPTTPPVAPTKGPAPPGGKAPTAGTPSGKAGKGKQTHDEAANVPKSPDAAKRWSEGLQALAELHAAAEKSPEDEDEIHKNIGLIKSRYGFTHLEAVPDGDYWDLFAEMNPNNKKSPAKAKRKTKKSRPWLGDKGEGKIGTYGGLPKPPGDEVTPHHIPQDRVMQEWKPTDYSHSKGICINMETRRHMATRTWGSRGSSAAKTDKGRDPHQVMQDDLDDVVDVYKAQNLYDAHKADIDAGLQRLKNLNLQTWTDLFGKRKP